MKKGKKQSNSDKINEEKGNSLKARGRSWARRMSPSPLCFRDACVAPQILCWRQIWRLRGGSCLQMKITHLLFRRAWDPLGAKCSVASWLLCRQKGAVLNGSSWPFPGCVFPPKEEVSHSLQVKMLFALGPLCCLSQPEMQHPSRNVIEPVPFTPFSSFIPETAFLGPQSHLSTF